MPGVCGDIQGLWLPALALEQGPIQLPLQGPPLGVAGLGAGESVLEEEGLVGTGEQGDIF